LHSLPDPSSSFRGNERNKIKDQRLKIKVWRHLESIPEYKEGWQIQIDTTGLIDNEYTYIYYECRVPIQFQKEEGWIIERDSLTTFFQDNMKKYGFNSQEICDFIAYWIPILNNSEKYIIFPQTDKEISPYIQLNFSEVSHPNQPLNNTVLHIIT
jgi:hypothetical protein